MSPETTTKYSEPLEGTAKRLGRAEPIRVWNRATGKLEEELVFGEGYLRWLYESRPGRTLSKALCSSGWFSQLYGGFQASPRSARKIPQFIRNFGIRMEEFEEGPFNTFNDFFIRRLKPGARVFASGPSALCAFAEGRYLGWKAVAPEQTFPVKGKDLTAEALLGDREKAARFSGGPLLIARLCPVDYHRFHFPDDGRVLENYRVHGQYHSVNPVALGLKSDIFITNERHVTILETQNFGRLAYIEVGALCVGKIVQTHAAMRDHAVPFKRGDEKGYFLFGGSTVVLVGEPGRWAPAADIVEQTANRRETLIRLGEPVARL